MVTNSTIVKLPKEVLGDDQLKFWRIQSHTPCTIFQMDVYSLKNSTSLRGISCFSLGEHSGVTRTYKRKVMGFHWNGMRLDIDKYITECAIYQQKKY
ncbi:hypothetical protein CR513_11081, partial [Mucuna pruriens]